MKLHCLLDIAITPTEPREPMPYPHSLLSALGCLQAGRIGGLDVVGIEIAQTAFTPVPCLGHGRGCEAHIRDLPAPAREAWRWEFVSVFVAGEGDAPEPGCYWIETGQALLVVMLVETARIGQRHDLGLIEVGTDAASGTVAEAAWQDRPSLHAQTKTSLPLL